MTESIYWVWNPKHGAPKVRHGSLEAATSEAARICQFNQNEEIFVIRAVSSFKYIETPIIKKNYAK